ncbi:MAG: 2-amino-4-hydroxy-6-hydroxymethyldihydropteridine diphosphokinase [Cyanobacteriota bacterium]|nr:2-amino-4-hydroxy-6-hydroxymethyldihydropteridine diphosphokinase [Cyanobacteriota bacterium]
MRVSLADQAGPPVPASLAIGLGANLPGPSGGPIATLIAVRPLLEASVSQWACQLEPPSEPRGCRWSWSPLFRTEPVGGPADQPSYVNAVVLMQGVPPLCPGRQEPAARAAADALLERLQELERHFGRERRERWGPRSLDLDLLWWGDLRCRSATLALPHPLWQQRAFVLAPLAALTALTALAALAPPTNQTSLESEVVPLPGQPGWPESLMTLE